MAGDAGRVRRHVIVAGVVQGVFFRDSTRRVAVREGVAGWARNLPNGTVEAVFEGSPGAVERAVEFCRHGPRGARVDRIDVRAEQPEGLEGFRMGSG